MWRQFGTEGWSSYETTKGKPGVVGTLFKTNNFLADESMNQLNALAR